MRRWIFILLLPLVVWPSARQTLPLRANGSIPAWIVLGSFPNIEIYFHDQACFGYHRDWLLPLGGEENAALDDKTCLEYETGKTASSHTVVSQANGLLNFPTIFKMDDYVVGVAYAFCRLLSDRDQSVLLHIRSNDGVKAWLNRRLIHEHHVGRQVETEQDLVPVDLKKGENPLLLKVDQGGGKWQLVVTLTDQKNNPVTGLAVQIESDDRIVRTDNAVAALSDYELESDIAARVRPRVSISEHFSLYINDRLCARDSDEYAVFPGEMNSIEILKTDEAALRTPLRLEWTRILPDGRSHTEQIRWPAAATRICLDLGLFAVPAVYSYEAGAVYRTATRFHLRMVDEKSASPVEEWSFYQTVDTSNRNEILRLGDAERVVHLGWDNPNRRQPLDPPILLSLDPRVLSHNDSMLVCCQRSGSASGADAQAKGITGLLKISYTADGRVVWRKNMVVTERSHSQRIPVSKWQPGEYKVEFVPAVAGTTDHEGPSLIYRRQKRDTLQVLLSPLAPWAFRRDPSRPEVIVHDFRRAVANWSTGLPVHGNWDFSGTGDHVSLVNSSGQWDRPPVVLQPGLTGWYAVFATAHNDYCYVQVGRHSIPRGIGSGCCFLDALDMTDEALSIFPAIVPGSGVAELRLIPVTSASVQEVRTKTSHPPVPLVGIADWGDFLCPPPIKHSAGGRLAPDQYDALLKGHAELGMHHMAWAIGRSVLLYNSTLPNSTRFPGVPLDRIADPEERAMYEGHHTMLERSDPLDEVLRRRAEYGVQISPWLAMNRHYGAFMDEGIHTSNWFVTHPQFHRWHKNAYGPCDSEVEYYFPHVRRDRVDIFCEVAERNPDGIVVGACRQVPMVSYHPLMVAEFKKRTGIDPQKIDGHQEKEYERWIRWRADFFTMALRELKERLEPIRKKHGRPIPVSIRVPSKGFFINLAQGLDVATWCREHLVDRLLLDPLEDVNGLGSHDVRPYVELGHQHAIEVYGAVNGNTYWNYAVHYKRALGLLQAGVDGIELYESNNQCILSQERWTVPMFGHADELSRYLRTSNIEACYPVWSRNAASGHDNHSFGRQWSIYGNAGSVL